MHETIEMLMQGDGEVVAYFVAARVKWAELLHDVCEISVTDLAERISIALEWFEANCGDQQCGREVMAWSGFASIYSNQDGYRRPGRGANEAVKLAEAFAAAFLGDEIKEYARKAAESYYICLENGRYVH